MEIINEKLCSHINDITTEINQQIFDDIIHT